MKAVSLLYHDVVDSHDFDASGRRGATPNRFKMETDLFDEHLREIRDRGASAATVPQLMEDSGSAAGTVMLTFDDGGSSALSHIADRLESLGWRGHFFIIADQVGEPGFLTRGEIRALHDRGHVLGTHTYSHPMQISRLPREEVVKEWRRGADALSDILGEPVRIGSVPGGFYSRKVAHAAGEAGLTFLFNSEPTTAVRRVGPCVVLGRYSLFGDSPAEIAGRFAARDLRLRASQWTFWNVKKVLKILGGDGYLWLRRRIIERGSEMEARLTS